MMAPAEPAPTNEWRIFGPPGTGKTTYLTKQVKGAVEKYGNEAVLVTSFTRAAAAELAGRDLPIARQNIGTLHSHCFRAIGNPKLAETKIKEWNAEHANMTLSASASIDEGVADQTYAGEADEMYAEMCRNRARMLDRRCWKPSVLRFANSWDAWKKDSEVVDFTDLLEIALRDVHIAPGNPSVLIADEAQDFSALQMALVRQWSNGTEYSLIAGDDDQCQPNGTMRSEEQHV